MGTHSQPLLQNRLIFTKLDKDEVLMVPYKCCFLARSQGGVKIGHGGPLLQKTSSDPKATAKKRMHSSDLEACAKKMFLILVHSEVKFFTHFLCLFGL